MAKFTFGSNLMELEIENLKFHADAMEVQAKAPSIQKKMNGIVESAGAEALDGSIVEKSCRTICECIDEMLGKGASQKIFKGRKVNFFDCMDVYFFVQSEVNGFTMKKLAEYDAAAKGTAGKGKKG